MYLMAELRKDGVKCESREYFKPLVMHTNKLTISVGSFVGFIGAWEGDIDGL